MRRIEMVGTPLDHVRSPALLGAWLASRGESVPIVKRELGWSGLDSYVAGARSDVGLVGLIVTTPLKQALVTRLSQRSPLVTFLCATNCIRCDPDGWTGANFDGHGFLAALAEKGLGTAAGGKILIAGCGGAGSAIAASLAREGPFALALYDIDRAKAAVLAARLRDFAPNATVDHAAEPTGTFDLIVNASTAGMHPGDASPFPAGSVAAACAIADIVTVEDTALKREAQRLHKPLLRGDAMVAGQIDLIGRFLLGTAVAEEDVRNKGEQQ